VRWFIDGRLVIADGVVRVNGLAGKDAGQTVFADQ
jgi:hypothetical protein